MMTDARHCGHQPHRTNTIFTYNCASSALANTAINTQQLIALLSRTLLLSCHLNDSLKQYGFRWSGLWSGPGGDTERRGLNLDC